MAAVGNTFPRTVPALCKSTGLGIQCLSLEASGTGKHRVVLTLNKKSVVAIVDTEPESLIGTLRLFWEKADKEKVLEVLGSDLRDHIKTML